MVEMVGVERRESDAPAGPEHPGGLGESGRAIQVLDDLAHENAVEPPCAERQPLGAGLPETPARKQAPAGLGEHRLRGVDAPDAGAAQRDRLGRAPGSAADVEHAPGIQAAEPHERVEDLGPGRVGRPQLVVALR
jgi:hypothetical protein